MAVQALYRKWRPQTFDELVGQQHVKRTLRNALTSDRIRHAYLFAGPRGTGKTTTARLLAKAVNCLASEEQRPCNACAICQAVNEGRLIDLIEIDAASNTGVDDVRELRERVGFRPNEARYKVYVIDEVHMLSNAAFNALLKTLEEPPPHAIFVLATTEPHKIPVTVLSRCQRFDFRRIPLDQIVERLAWMTEQEHITVDQEALKVVARQATGSMRDAESLLDQLASYDEGGISVADVRSALGTGDNEALLQVADALLNRDVAQGLETINAVVDQGTDPRQFARQIVDHLRTLLLLQLKSSQILTSLSEDMRPQLEVQAAGLSTRVLVKAIRLFNEAAFEAKGGWQPQLPLEMAFIEAALPPEAQHATSNPSPPPSQPSTPPSPARPKPASKSAPASQSAASGHATAGDHKKTAPAASADAAVRAVQETQSTYSSAAHDGALTPEALRAHWEAFLNALRPRNLPLEALMRSCEPVAVEGDVIVLGFAHDFHRGRVDEDKNRQDVEDVLSEILGKRYRVRCEMRRPSNDEGASSSSPPSSRADAGHDQPATDSAASPTIEDPLVRAAIEDLGAVLKT